MNGVKFDGGKARWSLLPWEAVKQVVDVLTYGAQKYAPDNWRKVPEWKDRYDSALERHLVAWRMGEWLDPETKLPHLAHALCCGLFLLAMEQNDRERVYSAPVKTFLNGPPEVKYIGGQTVLTTSSLHRLENRWCRDCGLSSTVAELNSEGLCFSCFSEPSKNLAATPGSGDEQTESPSQISEVGTP